VPASIFTHTVGRAARRLPGLRRLPIMRLLVLGEVIMIARTHLERLTPQERRRFVVLMRAAKGRPSTLSGGDHGELQALIAKVEPKLFAAAAADKLSPVPIPRSLRNRL
jgi:hypothetical protein